MLHALVNLDFDLLSRATATTAAHSWLQPLVYLAAQVVIFFFPIPLFVLWHKPELRGRHHGAQKAVMLAMAATVCAFAVKSAVGFLYFRPRPFISHPELLAMGFGLDPGSFPSGHTLIAFTIASSFLLSGYRTLGRALLILAVIVGLGRVYSGVHYPSDVLAGAVIGVCISLYLHRESSTIKRYLPNH